MLAIVGYAERALVQHDPLAPVIELCVFCSIGLAEAFVGGTGAPTVQCNEAMRIPNTAEQFGAEIILAIAKKFRPQSVHAVHLLELLELFGLRVEFPHNAIHNWPRRRSTRCPDHRRVARRATRIRAQFVPTVGTSAKPRTKMRIRSPRDSGASRP